MVVHRIVVNIMMACRMMIHIMVVERMVVRKMVVGKNMVTKKWMKRKRKKIWIANIDDTKHSRNSSQLLCTCPFKGCGIIIFFFNFVCSYLGSLRNILFEIATHRQPQLSSHMSVT